MSNIEILGKIILIPFFIVYIITLSKLRYSRRITMVLASVIIVLYFLITFLIIKIFYYLIYIYPILDLLYRIFNIIVMTALSLFLTRQRITQSIFITASVLVCISMVGIFAMAVLLFTGVQELLVRIALHTVIGLLICWARKPFLEFLDHTKKGWWLLCSVPIFLIANFMFITAIPVSLERNPDNLPAALMLCGTTITIYITLVYILHMMHKENYLEQNVMALRLFVSSLEHQNNIAAQNEKRISIFRHDQRHMFQLMSACLENGDVDGVRKLLSNMDMNMNTAESVTAIKLITNHKLLDATLCYYIDLARQSDIDITVRMERMDEIVVDKTELAVVLANAMQNAIEACKCLPDGVERVVRLDGCRRGKQFFLELVNICSGEVCFDPDTGLPVSNEEGHGLGSQSIAFFAKKHGSILQYHLEDHWFHLRLLM